MFDMISALVCFYQVVQIIFSIWFVHMYTQNILCVGETDS